MVRQTPELSITAEEVRNMSEADWNTYRQKSWLKKRDYYNLDMPSYYLGNRDRYADWIERLSKRFKKG